MLQSRKIDFYSLSIKRIGPIYGGEEDSLRTGSHCQKWGRGECAQPLQQQHHAWLPGRKKN